MPHPIGTILPVPGDRGWGESWSSLPWGGDPATQGSIGGQIVIRHDGPNPATKRNKFMRQQRQRMN